MDINAKLEYKTNTSTAVVVPKMLMPMVRSRCDMLAAHLILTMHLSLNSALCSVSAAKLPAGLYPWDFLEEHCND